MKKCPNCGKELPVDAEECPECGYSFRREKDSSESRGDNYSKKRGSERNFRSNKRDKRFSNKSRRNLIAIAFLAIIFLGIGIITIGDMFPWFGSNPTHSAKLVPKDSHVVKRRRLTNKLRQFWRETNDIPRSGESFLDDIDYIVVGQARLFKGSFNKSKITDSFEQNDIEPESYKGFETWNKSFFGEGLMYAFKDNKMIVGTSSDVKDQIDVIKGDKVSFFSNKRVKVLSNKMKFKGIRRISRPSQSSADTWPGSEEIDYMAYSSEIVDLEKDLWNVQYLFLYQDAKAASDYVDKVEKYLGGESYSKEMSCNAMNKLVECIGKRKLSRLPSLNMPHLRAKVGRAKVNSSE